MGTGQDKGSQGMTQPASKADLYLMSSSTSLGPHSERVLNQIFCIFYLDNDQCSAGKKTCGWKKSTNVWHNDGGEVNMPNQGCNYRQCSHTRASHDYSTPQTQITAKLPGLKRTDRESSNGQARQRGNEDRERPQRKQSSESAK